MGVDPPECVPGFAAATRGRAFRYRSRTVQTVSETMAVMIPPRCFLLLAALLLPPSLARGDEQHGVRQAVAAGRYKPLAEILSAVERQSPGRIVEVELEMDDVYGPVYEIEILDAGNRRREIKVHAQSGELLKPGDPFRPPPVPLPDMLRRLSRQYPGHVEKAEIKYGARGQPMYEVQLIQAGEKRLALLVDARTGEVRHDDPPRMARATPLADMLDALLRKYPGTVLEIELERDRASPSGWCYEIEILQPDGGTAKLRVDSRSAAILHEKTEMGEAHAHPDR